MIPPIAPLSAVEIAARRSNLWWLLSRLVTEEPTTGWLDELARALAAVDPRAATPLGPECADLLKALQRAQVEPNRLTALAVDRTRLLAGVLQNDDLPAPYESAVMGQTMHGDRASQVAALYADAGFEAFATELGPPDYLGTELRFMAALCYQEFLARRGPDPDTAAGWLEHQRNFLDRHVMDWVPAHCDRIRRVAATAFYVAVATLIARACHIDCADIDELSSSRFAGDRAAAVDSLEPSV